MQMNVRIQKERKMTLTVYLKIPEKANLKVMQGKM